MTKLLEFREERFPGFQSPRLKKTISYEIKFKENYQDD